MPSEKDFCAECGFHNLSTKHFRHLPRESWPEWMYGKIQPPWAKGQPESAGSPLAAPTAPVQTEVACECGWTPKEGTAAPQNDLRLHKMRSKIHKVLTVA